VTIPAGTLVPRDARDFGSYELIAKLATGGMAEIFLARSHSGGPKGKVVLKRILPHLAEDEHFVTMFRDEANLASRLIHANVCRVHGLGHHGATWFIVMEYLHGVALSRMLSRLAKKHQYIDFRIIAGIVVQACEGLHHAHELRDGDGHLLNVVHRDVSPPNIMLASDGLVKLLDFGIAKARGANSKTRTGTVKGKNAYMSPEQILGKPLDRRSDVFALGCVMYELLAVKRLFHRDSDFLTFKAITEEPIPDIRDRRPDIPLPLRAALTQALARDPNGRFATARAFSEAVKEAVAPLGGPATAVELKRFLVGAFGDELVARDELLKAADDPNAIPNAPMATTGSGATSSPYDLALRATDPPPTGRAPSTIEELETIDGELEVTDERKRPIDRAVDQSPSMIVTGGPIGPSAHTPPGLRVPGQPQPQRGRPRTDPPPFPSQPTPAPPPPTPAQGYSTKMPVIHMPGVGPSPGMQSPGILPAPAIAADPGTPRALSMAPTPAMGIPPLAAASYPLPTGPGPVPTAPLAYPAAGSLVNLDDPSELLRSHRRRSVLRTMLGVGALAAIGLIVFLIKLAGGTDGKPTRPVASVTPDAAPPPDARQLPDARDKRQEIIDYSRFGYLNLEASAKTTIFIDEKYAGPTPLTRYPVLPGIRKIKAIGPKNKITKFEVRIYGGKDTDAPMITWR
jgi:serine/threonine protein kinase